jgi:hypothetical protein
MQAELLAEFPRNAAEDATVNWGQVATYASQGISSGTSFDFNFFQDGSNLFDNEKAAGVNGLMRLHTKVANLITGGYLPAKGPGPVYSKVYPDHPEPQPFSADKRVGDGSWGATSNFNNGATVAATANAGTDFAWSPQEPFRPARGQYHQTSMFHMRYGYLSYVGYGLPGTNGQGLDPFYPRQLNDLLWAEGLLRSGGSKATVATLINKTRVGRGGLAPLTGAEDDATMRLALQYEQEVELLGISATPFFNRRRGTPEGWTLAAACPAINCLYPGTPRQMPVPAKELSVLGQPIYTFGGTGPDFAPSMIASGGGVYHAIPLVRSQTKRQALSPKQ